MATEDYRGSSSLPPYPQMIMEALDALNPSEGGNKATLSKFMEAKYGEMPCGHSDLLSDNLTMMKESGQLVSFKHNFLTAPGSTAPPLKRGRGRPPKPKDPLPVPAPSRPRGRPRKLPNTDPPAPKKSPTTGRPRGRPRKVNQQPFQTGVEA